METNKTAGNPASTKNLVDTAAASGHYSTLTTAIKAAGLVETLNGAGPFTIFAPTDEAFKKLPPADVEALLKDKTKLTALLTYHVVMGKIMAKDVQNRQVKSVQGGMLKFGRTDAGVTIDDSKVVSADLEASNGVIHGIDTIMTVK